MCILVYYLKQTKKNYQFFKKETAFKFDIAEHGSHVERFVVSVRDWTIVNTI